MPSAKMDNRQPHPISLRYKKLKLNIMYVSTLPAYNQISNWLTFSKPGKNFYFCNLYVPYNKYRLRIHDISMKIKVKRPAKYRERARLHTSSGYETPSAFAGILLHTLETCLIDVLVPSSISYVSSGPQVMFVREKW